jgi:hypothetical protein
LEVNSIHNESYRRFKELLSKIEAKEKICYLWLKKAEPTRCQHLIEVYDAKNVLTTNT